MLAQHSTPPPMGLSPSARLFLAALIRSQHLSCPRTSTRSQLLRVVLTDALATNSRQLPFRASPKEPITTELESLRCTRQQPEYGQHSPRRYSGPGEQK